MDSALVRKALANETRMKMVRLLSQRRLCLGALAEKVGASEPAAAQHLKVLREAGLVTGEKRGRFTHYDVQPDALRALAGELWELAEAQRAQGCAHHGAHGACGAAESGCGCHPEGR